MTETLMCLAFGSERPRRTKSQDWVAIAKPRYLLLQKWG